jgi:hypothetical protein
LGKGLRCKHERRKKRNDMVKVGGGVELEGIEERCGSSDMEEGGRTVALIGMRGRKGMEKKLYWERYMEF